ncbi:MAG: hypothetical protein EXR72_21840, partial [Myxococcales bacterium]|nr:hypothetical protein [Myxococcales bacterium]
MLYALALLAVKLSVLGIFAPTRVNLIVGGKTRALELRGGALLVDGTPQGSVRVSGTPAVPVIVTVLDGSRSRITRRFAGTIEARAAGGAIALTDELSDEDYLPGTVALEAAGDHPEAQRAQAVLARTFLARGSRHPGAGHDLCDLTHCQTFRGFDGETPAARAAVAATAGQVLLFQGRLADVYFTAVC